MKKFVHGYPTTPPDWLLVLEAAGNDPHKAQVIYDEINGIWWHRYLTWRKIHGDYMAEQERKARRKSGKK